MNEPRTPAGEMLLRIVHAADDRDTGLPQVANTFTEGEHDTASVWLRVEGKYFQVHVTELDPTESDLDFYRRGGAR